MKQLKEILPHEQTVIMTFSTFGFYGQIWLNRDFTYEAAIEEMPAGYGDTLMSLSPGWAFPVVISPEQVT